VKEAREQPIASTYREQFETFVTAWLSRLLYALGQFDQSLVLARRVLRAPNREGLTSYSSEMQEAVYTVDYYAVLKARIEQLAERGSGRSTWQQLGLWLQRVPLELEVWRTRRRATKLLAHGGMLSSLLRPYLKPFPAWNAVSLVEVAGAAVVRRVIDQMRLKIVPGRKTEAYWQALEAFLAYRAGDHVRVLELARRCLDALPQDEALLRARVGVWAGAAAYEQGDRSVARKYFDHALYRWPTAFRVERVALPVRISSDKDPIAQQVARRMLDSRRLRRDTLDTGFAVFVARRGQVLETCLTGARGRRYACATSKAPDDPDDDDRISAVVDDFHDTVFAPLVDLTQQDISSLDGSAVRGRADEVLREVFGQ
jgi:tetratricopeptide (TPR) repeat protein